MKPFFYLVNRSSTDMFYVVPGGWVLVLKACAFSVHKLVFLLHTGC